MATTPTDPQSPNDDPGDTVNYINPLSNLLSGIYVLNPVYEAESERAYESLNRFLEFTADRFRPFETGNPGQEFVPDVRRLQASVLVISDFAQTLNSEVDIGFTADGVLAAPVHTRFGALLPKSVLVDIATRSSNAERNLGLVDLYDPRESLRIFDALKTHLQQVDRNFFSKLFESLIALQGQDDRFDLNLGQSLRERVQRRANVVAAQSAEAARNSAVHASTASGKAATNRQARSFTTLGQEEHRAARFWTACAFILITVGVVVPLAILPLELSIPSVDGPVAVVLKLVVALPIFGGAAYSARIAAGHREHARNLRLAATQVDTLEAFIEPMDETARNDTRALLARRIFTTTGDLTSRPADTISVIPAELIPLLERVVDKADRGKA